MILLKNNNKKMILLKNNNKKIIMRPWHDASI